MGRTEEAHLKDFEEIMKNLDSKECKIVCDILVRKNPSAVLGSVNDYILETRGALRAVEESLCGIK